MDPKTIGCGLVKRPGRKKKTSSDQDRRVGQRVKLLRMMAKMSQKKLGELLDVSFQQVQKYEKGTNRISAVDLHQIANALNVPVSHLLATEEVQPQAGFGEPDAAPFQFDFDTTADGVRMAQAFASIPDGAAKRRLLLLAEALASGRDAPKEQP